MQLVEVHPLVSFTLSIVLLFIGKNALERSSFLRRYGIPEPVIGGLLCAFVVGGLYYLAKVELSFSLGMRDWLLLYFFAAIGLKSDIRTLISGGRPLVYLTVLAAVFIVIQNLVGMGTAAAFGMNPKAGLMAGSVSLTGGIGTALAWAPKFVEELGISNALEIAVASNTIGLISACCIGGPIAAFLIKRHHLTPLETGSLDVGSTYKKAHTPIDSYAILWAWLWLNVALIAGYFIHNWLTDIGLQLPQFVACLIAGIIIRNLSGPFENEKRRENGEAGLAIISDLCLGMFLTMALMTLKIWELQGVLLFLTVVMIFQILLTVGFTLLVVFRVMGKDYESSVISAGFGGITLGSTATAIVNMTAVTKQHGAAHRAFIVVPLVCGFFVDLINAFVISWFVGA